MEQEMQQLIQQFMDRYLTREEIAWRLPVSLPISEFWPLMLEARQKAAIHLPLKTQSGEDFRFVPNVSIVAQCNKVASLARRSLLLEQLPAETAEEAILDEAVWSSVIEGAFTSRAEAAKIILQNRSPVNRSEQMVKNNYQALLYVLEHLQEPITLSTLIELAGIVTKDASDETVSGLRTVPIFVAGPEGIIYTPPAAFSVPAMMDSLITFIQSSELHPLYKACIAHFYLVYVHPFTDGNGRTARALSLMMLMRSGYDFFRYFSISGIITEERNAYYRSMRNVEASGSDMTYFIDYYSAILARSVEKMEKELLGHIFAQKKIALLEDEGKLNERQLKGAKWLLEGEAKQVTTEAWRKKFKTAPETARRDLLLLCEEGLLQRTMDGRKAVFLILR